MNNTKIEWCDSTWNPVTGCLHGCEYCYARQMTSRFKGYDKIILPDTSISKGRHVLEEPAEKNGAIAPYPFDFEPTFHRYLLNKPRKWRKPRTIFVGSMADLFGDWVPGEWIEQVFNACKKAPKHRYLFLTKNPERYVGLDRNGKLPRNANMWYGSTMTTQRANFLIDRTRNTFLNIEPLLSDFPPENTIPKSCINWIIIGAETGNRKDKVVPEKEWIDNICRAADNAELPVFMKDSLIPIVGEENMRREFPW